jgi:RHS repeat-associated protein
VTEQAADTNPLTTVTYYLDDHLGTTQVELADGGWPLWQGQFTPFGSELPDGPTTMHYKFTGKERDAESGIDNFGARYYGNTVGRWMSPDWAEKPEDVPYAKMDNPQSLNLYSYVGNNPLSRVDPDGHCWPQWLCNFVTKVKNEVLHGEFTTDTDGAKIRQLDRQEAKDRQKKQFLEEMGKHPPHVQVGIVAPIELAPLFLERTTYLYEKLGPNGEHLKYGITSNNPDGRYTTKELNGGKLKILAKGSRGDMLEMERNLHETMPIGPEEGQSFYEDIQAAKGLKTPPYDPLP